MEATQRDESGDPLIGERIGGRYRVERRLGEGGAGIVYEATHEELDRPVAIKVLGAAWAYDPKAAERFEREARAASRVGHRHIVDVYDLGRLEDGRPYLVMERLSGEPVDAVLERRGRLDWEQVRCIVSQAASALDAVHRRGIVHRDIKPENLFLVYHEGIDEPELKLLDFGLAAIARPGSTQQRLTVQGMVHGTPHYMAPEATGDTLPDHRADVYSLAVVAFELLTGDVPFDSPNPLKILTRKTIEDAPALSQVTGEPWPEELEQLFAKALSRSPNMRHQSAGELARALAAGLEAPMPEAGVSSIAQPQLESPAAEPEAGTRAVRTMITRRPPRRAEGRRRARGWVAAFAVALIGAVGSVALVSWRADDSAGERPAPADPPSEPHATVGASDPTEPAADEAPGQPPPPAAEARAQAPEREVADAPARRAVARRPRPITRPPAGAANPAGQAREDEGGEEVAPAPTEPPPRLAEESRARARELTREGTAMMLQGRLPEAIQRFRDATIAYSRYAPAWRGLGLANERLGRRPEARRAYERYLTLAPRAGDGPEVRRRLEALR